MLAIVSLSGGMDSATVLAEALAAPQTTRVVAASFVYGSKHNAYERASAEALATFYDVELVRIDFSSPFGWFSSSLLKSGGPIPEGHYEDATMAQTVVPARNIIFAAYLAGLAWSRSPDEASCVWLGVHSGDHAIYPDCRPAFVDAMREALARGTDQRVRLAAPFMAMDKAGILRRGFELRVPYELTRTCYKDQLDACGKCGSCQERLEAFAKMEQTDPVHYEP